MTVADIEVARPAPSVMTSSTGSVSGPEGASIVLGGTPKTPLAAGPVSTAAPQITGTVTAASIQPGDRIVAGTFSNPDKGTVMRIGGAGDPSEAGVGRVIDQNLKTYLAGKPFARATRT